MSAEQWKDFEALRSAWQLKAAAMELWDHAPRDHLRTQWLVRLGDSLSTLSSSPSSALFPQSERLRNAIYT